MDNDFLFDLYSYCMESVPCPESPAIKRAQEEWETLEKKLVQTMGLRFADHYQDSLFRANAWQEKAAFLEGLRFGVNLMLTVFPYSSSSKRES